MSTLFKYLLAVSILAVSSLSLAKLGGDGHTRGEHVPGHVVEHKKATTMKDSMEEKKHSMEEKKHSMEAEIESMKAKKTIGGDSTDPDAEKASIDESHAKPMGAGRRTDTPKRDESHD